MSNGINCGLLTNVVPLNDDQIKELETELLQKEATRLYLDANQKMVFISTLYPGNDLKQLAWHSYHKIDPPYNESAAIKIIFENPGKDRDYTITDTQELNQNTGSWQSISRPVITYQPRDVVSEESKKATFSVKTNAQAPQYTWQYTKNGTTWYETNMEGNNTDTVYVQVTTHRNGYQYRCKITDSNGYTLYSKPGLLTVI